MASGFVRHAPLRSLAVCMGLLALGVPPAYGQRQSEDSNVGYIDSALPISRLRMRVDAAYDLNRPTRAEFFYAPGPPRGPGLPMPEPRVDYQELSAYVENAFGPRFSGFLEAPVRFLNPEVNDNATGIGDLNGGFKFAFLSSDDLVASFQLRTYVPTGDASRGLGTRHVSLEPAVLVYARLTERWQLEGELRYWVAVEGADFAGDLVRYGLGLSYGERPAEGWWVCPVAEVVGWTILSGKELNVPFATSPGFVQGASGDTIVNLKIGVRAGLGPRTDIYGGYGRALTGETWYTDTWRVEFRVRF